MHSGLWVLLITLVGGLIGRNPLVISAVLLLLLLALQPFPQLLALAERYSLNAGLTLLIIGLLMPFANGKLDMNDMITGIRQPIGLMALVGGALAAYMNGKGLAMLEVQPEIIIGLVAGTILGVGALQGIPVGPLAAAGITAVIHELWRMFAAR